MAHLGIIKTSINLPIDLEIKVVSQEIEVDEDGNLLLSFEPVINRADLLEAALRQVYKALKDEYDWDRMDVTRSLKADGND